MSRSILLIAIVLSAAVSSLPQKTPDSRPVDVPDINGMAVSLIKPAFPETAIAVDADGATTVVRVVVDENGIPVSAQCSLDCNAMLKDAAEQAALNSRFKPLVVKGKPVKYQGTLMFTFVVARVNWVRFATALESVRQFDNLSVGPVAQMLSTDFAKEKEKLLSLDVEGVTFETRQKVLTEVTTAIKSRLKDTELWHFDLASALRRISFWTMAAEHTDRAELQKSIEAISSVIASAPEGTSDQLLSDLRTVAAYRVPADLKEQDLRRAIFELTKKVHLRLK